MFIVIDMGGTNTRVGVSKDFERIMRSVKFGTRKNLSRQRKLITTTIKELVGNNKVNAIAFGVPGTLDLVNKRFLVFPNYKVLEGHSFDDLLSEADFNCSVFFENDASLGGLGAAIFDLKGMYKNVYYLALGTGVGGSLIEVKGDSFEYSPNEPGHEITLSNGKTIEQNLSGPSFRKKYGVSPALCDSKESWDQYASLLYEAAKELYKKFNFDVLIIGGSVANKYDKFYPPLERLQKSDPELSKTRIRQCKLSDETGLYGGLAYLVKKLMLVHLSTTSSGL